MDPNSNSQVLPLLLISEQDCNFVQTSEYVHTQYCIDKFILLNYVVTVEQIPMMVKKKPWVHNSQSKDNHLYNLIYLISLNNQLFHLSQINKNAK